MNEDCCCFRMHNYNRCAIYISIRHELNASAALTIFIHGNPFFFSWIFNIELCLLTFNTPNKNKSNGREAAPCIHRGVLMMSKVMQHERDNIHSRYHMKNSFHSPKCVLLLTHLYFIYIFHFRLDEHLIACHQYQKDLYRCDHCPKSYCYRPSLLRHRSIVHGELRKYPCENCRKVRQNIIF